jgi:ABC-2 type transport system permease protein
MGEGSRHPLIELTLARLREFGRERGAIFWTFGFPVLLAIGLGIAFRDRPPEASRVAIEEGAQAERAAGILTAIEGVQAQILATVDAREALRSGQVDLVLTADAEGGGWTYRYDPQRPQSRHARLRVDDGLQRGLGRADAAPVRDEIVAEKGARYIDFLIPGLIGLNVMSSSLWGIGYAVVLARRRRLLKRLAATPMRHSHYLLSFMLSRLLFLVAEVAVLVAFGWLAFGVVVHGSLLGVGVISILGALSFMGMALLIAARPESTEVASGWMNAAMLPMWMLSGSFFSYERFPELVQPAIRLLPLTAFNDSMRAVINEGVPLWQTWPEMLVMAAWGGLTFLLAMRLFRWL